MTTGKPNNDGDFQFYKFATHRTPQCLWGYAIQKENQNFLKAFEPKYFTYLADKFYRDLEELEDKNAALAIRQLYSQSLETLFAFIGAALQAPYGVLAWLSRYNSRELTSLVSDIHSQRPILSQPPIDNVSWQDVSNLLLTRLMLEDKEKEIKIKRSYGEALKNFAADFLEGNSKVEYNSIKHGLRNRPGAFYMRMGREETPGVRAPEGNMQTIAYGKYGSSFVVPYEIQNEKSNRNFYVKRIFRNWSPEDMTWGIYLIEMLLENTVAHVKILNGEAPDSVTFSWPSGEAFKKPWGRSGVAGAFEMTMGVEVPSDAITPFSDQEILDSYKKKEK